MNRQLRRAQEKQEKKLEKEKQERREERQRRLAQLREQRQKQRDRAKARSGDAAAGEAAKGAAAKESGKPAAGPRRDPGRFSGALAIATVFFIVLQAAVPVESASTFDSFVKAGFYLMFGYFLTLWLMRRGQQGALPITLMGGLFLLAGTWLAALVRPEAPLDTLALLIAVPFLLGGVWLGRLVYTQTPT